MRAGYDPDKIHYLYSGFSTGFDIGYRGLEGRRDTSRNLPLRVGSPLELWNKVMKEVKRNRYSGPFTEEMLPFNYFVQSPVGLVPKTGGKTRLIFHLSYDFGEPGEEDRKSINHHTPDDLCSVHYNNLDHVIKNSLQILKEEGSNTVVIYYAKTDCFSAFRLVPTKPLQCHLLVMRVQHPVTKVWYYFIDKCLPFGSSRSCKIFQDFSDALRFLAEYRMIRKAVTNPRLTNYLDDFLFLAACINRCTKTLVIFLEVCDQIGCPIAEEKTEWPQPILTFLGTLLNGVSKTLSIPMDKIQKTRQMLRTAIQAKKVTIKFVQQITGMLNFLNRAIVPGRAFTRGMYAKLKIHKSDGSLLQQHHHVHLNTEFIQDCWIWLHFLDQAAMHQAGVCRPFVDFAEHRIADDLFFFTDASKNREYGIGGLFNNAWIYECWPVHFIAEQDPSIEFLELYALACALFTWKNSKELKNSRIGIYCDNQAVQSMVNNLASSCTQCMKLIRLIPLFSIQNNSRIFVNFVRSKQNFLADSLSRMNLPKFKQMAPATVNSEPDAIIEFMTPVTKIWNGKVSDLLHFFYRS